MLKTFPPVVYAVALHKNVKWWYGTFSGRISTAVFSIYITCKALRSTWMFLLVNLFDNLEKICANYRLKTMEMFSCRNTLLE